jgi:hypothetical protein
LRQLQIEADQHPALQTGGFTMFNRTGVLSLFLAIGLAAVPVHAQNQPAAQPTMQDMMAQQMQFVQKILQNMQAKGIDPQQFFQQIATQMQDGTLDQAAIEQQMIDKGIIDRKSLDDMQSSMKSMMMIGIKGRLGVTDDEWTALQPAIQRVITDMAAVGQNSGGMGMGMGMGATMGGASTPADLAKAKRDLGAAITNTSTTPQDFADKLQALRDSRAKAQAELDDARKNLTSLTTVRQEGILTVMGIL